MVTEDALKHHFQTLGVNVEELDILRRCLDLCDLYNVSEEVLVESWVAFMVEKNVASEPTLTTLDQMEKDILKKQHQSTVDTQIKKKSSTTSNQGLSDIKDDDNMEDMLRMYGCTEPLIQQAKRQRSPEGADLSAIGHEPKIRAIEATFVADTYTRKSESPGRVIKSNSQGTVLRKFGSDVSDWKTKTVWKIAVEKIDDLHVPPQARFMFELSHNKSLNMMRVCREFGARLCSDWSKNTKAENDIKITSNVMTQSQTTYRTWGRVLDENEQKLTPATVMLEGCKAQKMSRLPSIIKLDISALQSYSLFPGQILAVDGKNPTGNSLVAESIFASGYPPPSPPPKLQENLHIVVAVGPFTASSDLQYEPLFHLVKRLVDTQPHILILVGPFLPVDHQDIRNATIRDTFQYFFERVIDKIMKLLEGKCTQVILIPSSNDAHHFPVYPTPEYFLSKITQYPNLHLMPDPCMMNFEGLIIGGTSIDIIRHLSSEEICRAMPGEERTARLASHILSQACFYPLYPPPLEVNLDTKLWESHAFMYQQPHILILPSDMRCFCKWTKDCFVINPERLNKHTYAQIIVKPSVGEPLTDQHIDCEISRL